MIFPRENPALCLSSAVSKPSIPTRVLQRVRETDNDTGICRRLPGRDRHRYRELQKQDSP